MESEYLVTLTISVKVFADDIEDAKEKAGHRSEWMDWFHLETGEVEKVGDWRVTIWYPTGAEDIVGPKGYVISCREIAINNGISVSGISEVI